MTPAELRAIAAGRSPAGRELEASGGITLDTIRATPRPG